MPSKRGRKKRRHTESVSAVDMEHMFNVFM